MFLSIEDKTRFIKQQAQQLGFSYCGIARAMPLYDDAKRLEQWLNKGMHGQMKYMENHFDMRINPQQLVPNAQSVITLLKNYYPAQQQQAYAPLIAKYAYGQDYHEVIRTQLQQFLLTMQTQLGQIEGRGFVDSAPVLERSWAQRSFLLQP
jgi:epoxyqueuosine reductase